MKKRFSVKRRKADSPTKDYKSLIIEEDNITPLEASFLGVGGEEE